MNWRRWIPIVKVCVGVSLLAYILRGVDYEVLGKVRERWIDFGFFFGFAGIVYVLAFSLTMLRWNLFLQAFGVPHRLGDTFRLGWVGLIFSQVTPGATGGDLAKAYYITRDAPDRKAEAVLSVLLDRIVGLFALFVLGSIACLTSLERVSASPALTTLASMLGVGVLLGLFAGILLAWRPFWEQAWLKSLLERLPGRRILRKLALALWEFHGKRRLLLISLGISLVNHCINVSLHVIVWRAMVGGAADLPPVGLFFFLVPLGMLANAIPISPGGLGVGEAAYQELFQCAGLEHGAELAILVRMLTLLVSSVGIYYYLRGKKELRRAVEEAERDALLERDRGPSCSIDVDRGRVDLSE